MNQKNCHLGAKCVNDVNEFLGENSYDTWVRNKTYD